MKLLVAYPGFTLEKFKSLGPNEDAKAFLKILEKNTAFSFGLDQQTLTLINPKTIIDKKHYLFYYKEDRPLKSIKD